MSMKALVNAFKHVTKKLSGADRPKARAIVSSDLKPISAAAHSSDLKALKPYLERYQIKSVLDLTRSLESEWSLLHYAAKRGHVELLGMLLDYGADIHDKTRGGATPLHIAASDGRKDVLEFLLMRGAAVDAPDGTGATPLSAAALKGHKESCELLLNRGAAVDAKNAAGFTALNWALGHPATMKLLIDRGADVNATDAAGTPILNWACSSSGPEGGAESVAVLLSHKVALPQDKSRCAALKRARLSGHGDVAELIEQEYARREHAMMRLSSDHKPHRFRLKPKA
jgi:ankyrin repeat protein